MTNNFDMESFTVITEKSNISEVQYKAIETTDNTEYPENGDFNSCCAS